MNYKSFANHEISGTIPQTLFVAMDAFNVSKITTNVTNTASRQVIVSPPQIPRMLRCTTSTPRLRDSSLIQEVPPLKASRHNPKFPRPRAHPLHDGTTPASLIRNSAGTDCRLCSKTRDPWHTAPSPSQKKTCCVHDPEIAPTSARARMFTEERISPWRCPRLS